jgi:hypothetical protein
MASRGRLLWHIGRLIYVNVCRHRSTYDFAMNKSVTLTAAAAYREKAAELRRQALTSGSDEVRDRIESIAVRWEHLAERAEAETQH